MPVMVVVVTVIVARGKSVRGLRADGSGVRGSVSGNACPLKGVWCDKDKAKVRSKMEISVSG